MAHDLVTESAKSSEVAGNGVVVVVTPHHCLKPGALLGDPRVPLLQQRPFDLLQFGTQSLTHRLPPHEKVFLPAVAPTVMSETKKIEYRRLTRSTPLTPFDGVPPKFEQPRLVGLQGQPE